MALILSSELTAKTVTDPPEPARTQLRTCTRVVWLFGVTLAAVLLVGCSASWSSDQGKKISPKGSAYSYKVPHGWMVAGGNSFKVEGRSFQTAVRGQTGLATVAVSQQTIKMKITPSNLSAIQSEYKREAATWQFPPTNWQKTSLAGAPALRFNRSGKLSTGEKREMIAYVAFKGRIVFYVDCMYTADTKSDVEKACSKVTESLVLH